jgi:hypothetical protein
MAPTRPMQVVRIIVCILSFGFIFPHAFVESTTDADPGTPRPLRSADAQTGSTKT